MSKQTNFINKVKQGAIEGQKKYSILASLTMSQAILESGWGKSGLANKGNNLFGIKRNGCPNYVIMPTKEFYNGKWVTINAAFRKYNSWNESVKDHAKFLINNSRYHNLIGIKDYRVACKLIKQDGYATAPNYTDTLISIIEENKLYKYDKEDFDMKLLVTYLGDADLFGAIMVAQKNHCALMKKSDFDKQKLAVKKVIQIGGKKGSTRFSTFKDAAKLV